MVVTLLATLWNGLEHRILPSRKGHPPGTLNTLYLGPHP